MKNKDIHEWLLDEGIDPLTTVTIEKGEYYLSDILEKHLTEQLCIDAVSNSEVFEHYGNPFTSGRDLWNFLTAHYNFTPKT